MSENTWILQHEFVPPESKLVYVSDIFISAAERIDAGFNYYCCSAIKASIADEYEGASVNFVQELFATLFSQNHSVFWWGPHESPWSDEDIRNNERMDRERILALLFAAAYYDGWLITIN